MAASVVVVLIPSSSGCGAHFFPASTTLPEWGLNPFFFRVRCSPACMNVHGWAPRLNPFFFRVRCSRLMAGEWRTTRRLNPFFFRVRCSRGPAEGVDAPSGS